MISNKQHLVRSIPSEDYEQQITPSDGANERRFVTQDPAPIPGSSPVGGGAARKSALPPYVSTSSLSRAASRCCLREGRFLF